MNSCTSACRARMPFTFQVAIFIEVTEYIAADYHWRRHVEPQGARRRAGRPARRLGLAMDEHAIASRRGHHLAQGAVRRQRRRRLLPRELYADRGVLEKARRAV